ncbi:MAG: beta-L-arabinofuranosidase domain-containing protein, partial [Sedimentisphaerales bacterium]
MTDITGANKGKVVFAASVMVMALWLTVYSAAEGAANKDKVSPVVIPKAEPFALEDVRLLEGPFQHAMELDHKYLLSLDADRLLHSFRLNAGLVSNAKPYGGWMTPGRVSCAEFVGHYLSACA